METAVSAAASIAVQTLQANRAVGMTVSSRRQHVLPPDRGTRVEQKILHLLANVQADGSRPLAEVLDQLLPKIDFLSIGTNDLTQFLFAADRADPRLAERYDWLSPSILRFLRRVSRQAREAGIPVRVCGEMGGRPLEAMALIGLGIEQFSITPAAVAPIKAMVRSLDAGRIRTRVEQLLDRPPASMRKTLADWARRHKVAIG